jgi:hypothetical protein
MDASKSSSQTRIQNPRGPPDGHLGFWVALFLKRTFLWWTSNHKKISGKSEQVFLSSMETKAGCTYIPGCHLFWAAFERNLPLVKLNPQKISGQSAIPFLRYSPEYKIQDVHLVAILDFGWHWFSKGTFL